MRDTKPHAKSTVDELRHSHGWVVDTADGHLGTVLHVLETPSGHVELVVKTRADLVHVPEEKIRHVDAHEGRIAVVL
jgi:ribosomal 30S subunit maturation factor RimM